MQDILGNDLPRSAPFLPRSAASEGPDPLDYRSGTIETQIAWAVIRPVIRLPARSSNSSNGVRGRNGRETQKAAGTSLTDLMRERTINGTQHLQEGDMAKRKAGKGEAADGGESISGYFRKVFKENPKLLTGRSNDELLQRWLKDHPGETEVPKKVKANLSNIKSVLRKKGRKGRRSAAPAAGTGSISAHGLTASKTRGVRGVRGLEQLEEQIDDCLTLAKNLDREGLADVISHLRTARNRVVWKTGQ